MNLHPFKVAVVSSLPAIKTASKVLLPVVVVVVGSFVPEIASADSAAAIDAAITQGETLLGKVAPGLITIAAIMTGVGLVISWIRK